MSKFPLFLTSFSLLLAVTPLNSAEVTVRTIEEAGKAVASAAPGDTVVLANGTYEDFTLVLTARGTDEKPIVFRSETPGRVVFSRAAGISVKESSNLIVDGFVFDRVLSKLSLVGFHLAEKCRLTNCAFFDCGDPRSTFRRMINIGGKSINNRVDHCYMQGNLSMGMAVVYNLNDQESAHNQFDHNHFKDIVALSENGQEAIQIGQGSMTGVQHSHTLVEFNLFENASGDPEVISIKASDNIIRYNTFRDSNAELTFRGSPGNRVEGNYFFNNKGGMRVFGGNQTIVSNYIEGSRGTGIRMQTGAENAYGQSRNCTVANNTIVNCEGIGLHVGALNHLKDVTHIKPADNSFVGNLVVGKGDPLIQDDGERSTWRNNQVWAQEQASLIRVEGVTIADPVLKREGEILRPTKSGAGCDLSVLGGSLRRPLKPADVGPAWMKGDIARASRVPAPLPQYNASLR